MLFGMLFCAVSLAIVWGTTLERIKFAAYAIYALVFGAVIYPLVAHGVYGGGLLADVGGKPVMDFAGSSVVHLTGAVGALAALLLLGPRIGKYDAEGKPRAIPGHSMPLVGLGVAILWVGWYGFNAGSTFGTTDNFMAEVALNTQLAAAAGVVAACLFSYLKTKSVDVGMAGNGAIAGLVAITAPSGYVEFWAAPIIGFVGGMIVVYGVLRDRQAPRRSGGCAFGARSRRYLGDAGGRAVRLPAPDPRGRGPGHLVRNHGRRIVGLDRGQFAVQAVGVAATFALVFALSYAVFLLIKKTIGLRVDENEELAGLDISSHGMYGYPESFIPPGGVSGWRQARAVADPPDRLWQRR